FWQYGRWVDVVIDDRLPTVDNKLVYLRSTDPNEFWTALLEKAYAKLYGSYKNIEGGQISEAMEDMCGGLSEFYRTSRPQIYEIIKMSYERSSFMGCSIVSSELEGERPDGLITSHAYSITKVQSIMMNNSEVKLLRLRNPWGNNAEWKGTWNDNSEYWNLVSQETRDNLLLRKNDGEFWMEVEDFQRLFTFLDICHLNPSSFFYYEGDNKKWNISMFDGTWIPNVTAGGGLELEEITLIKRTLL
ncbi:calpain-A, partial [Asbolus verrucosus]